jgi:Protein of unknown function (DUF3300)
MKNLIRYLTLVALIAVLIELGIAQQLGVAQLVQPSSGFGQRSPANLEKLVAPIALYPDPLVAVMLSAAAHPADVVLAARYIAMNQSPANIDNQPWDANVRTLARFPSVIQRMHDDLSWTIELGQAFSKQPMELMDAIQTFRARAQSTGALHTTPEQVVTVNQAIVERAYEKQILVVTNTVVEIVPANREVIYVPVYNPAVIYAPPPTYVYNQRTPLIIFGTGIRAGRFIGNSHIDWYYGGVYHVPGGGPVWAGWNRGYPYYRPPPYQRPPWYHPPSGPRPPPHGYYPPPGHKPPPPGNKPPPSRPSPN